MRADRAAFPPLSGLCSSTHPLLFLSSLLFSFSTGRLSDGMGSSCCCFGRLLGANGLPRLRQLARTLKLKGKGHEFSDAARLLSLYQMWLDDLFPKAKFLDALAMVEKAGHKKRVVAARNEFMNEGKPKQQAEHNDDDDHGRQQDVARESVEGAEQEGEGGAQTGGARPTTPSRRQDDGVPDGEDDLYDATPRQQQGRRTTAQDDDGVPGDEDDLDALIAEAEARDQGAAAAAAARRRSPTPDEGDMDDLDALIAEAEAGDGSAGRRVAEHDFGDDEAAMQEMQG